MNEIASREFIDNLVSILHNYNGPPLNSDVKNKILELLQTWAGAAEGRTSLTYINETYRTLAREGFSFPPKETVASSMFDTVAPPEWADSDVCMRCRTAFTMLNRKHHCRNCGNVFCGQCSSKSVPLPHLGITQAVRVDDGCYARLMEKNKSTDQRTFEPSRPARTLYQGSMEPRNARVDDGFDAELKKALELSLEEAKGVPDSGYVPQAAAQPSKPRANGSSSKVKDDDDDPELRAAIEASLTDMEEQKQRHSASLKAQPASSSSTSTSTVRKDHELSLVEMENISLFSTLVERLQHQPPGTILREPQIQELYESIGSLRPKLARTYGETMSKHDTLLDLHSKLSTVVRYYDRMLEERFSNTYSSQQHYGGYPGNRSSMYPSLSQPQHPGSAHASGMAAESFYTGQPSAPPSADAYATQGYPQAQAIYPPNSSSPVYDRRAPSVASSRVPNLKYRQHSIDTSLPPRQSSLQYSESSTPLPQAPPQDYSVYSAQSQSSQTPQPQHAQPQRYAQTPTQSQYDESGYYRAGLENNYPQVSPEAGSARFGPGQPQTSGSPEASFGQPQVPSQSMYPPQPPQTLPQAQSQPQPSFSAPQQQPSQSNYPAHAQPSHEPMQGQVQSSATYSSQSQQYPAQALQAVGTGAFPSVPGHAPQSAQTVPAPPRVEESLIEL